MGIFSRFTKHETYNKETGRFETRPREIKELTYEEQMDTPENRRRQRREQRRLDREKLRSMEREAYQKAYQQARVKRATQRGMYRGGTPWYDRIQTPTYQPRPYKPRTTTHKKKKSGSKTKYKVIGGKAYPIAGTSGKKKTTRKRRSSDFGFDFDPIDNWRF